MREIQNRNGLAGGRWVVALRVGQSLGKLKRLGYDIHAAQGEDSMSPIVLVIFVVERCRISSSYICRSMVYQGGNSGNTSNSLRSSCFVFRSQSCAALRSEIEETYRTEMDTNGVL